MTSQQQLEEFIDRYSPRVARVARGPLARLRRMLPGAVQMVYDNAYALVIGFGATDRASEAVLSVAMYQRHVSVCFLWGADWRTRKACCRAAASRSAGSASPTPGTWTSRP